MSPTVKRANRNVGLAASRHTGIYFNRRYTLFKIISIINICKADNRIGHMFNPKRRNKLRDLTGIVNIFFYITLLGCSNAYSQGINIHTIKAEFRKIDVDKNGLLSFQNIQAYVDKRFTELDKDNNGVLDPQELRADKTKMFATLGINNDKKMTRQEAHAKFKEYFEKMDSNHDDSVSEDDFVRFWKAKFISDGIPYED